MNQSAAHLSPPCGRVLIIAGSDSGGGAGIQGDIKTVSALGGYAMTAITALTAQNTLGVFGVHPVPEAFIAQQITLCLEDIGADAIKTGMLHSAAVIETIVQTLDEALGQEAHPPLSRRERDGVRADTTPSPCAARDPLPPGEGAPASRPVPLVVDPVMVAKGGSPLLEASALHALKTKLIPRATIITPNLPEAELLLGRPIDEAAMEDAARTLLDLGCGAVLLKGGHGRGAVLRDVLVSRTAPTLTLTAQRLDTRHTHGTGCTFASAIACSLAQRLTLEDAVTRAHAYVQAAIVNAPGLGSGNGPLGHHLQRLQ